MLTQLALQIVQNILRELNEGFHFLPHLIKYISLLITCQPFVSKTLDFILSKDKRKHQISNSQHEFSSIPAIVGLYLLFKESFSQGIFSKLKGFNPFCHRQDPSYPF